MLLSEPQIGDNLRRIFAHTGLSQKDFCTKSGIDYANISNYMKAKGNNLPSAKVKNIIELGYNGTWYLTGVGEMVNKHIDKEVLALAEIGRKALELRDLMNEYSLEKVKTFSANFDSSSAQLDQNRAAPSRSEAKRKKPQPANETEALDDTIYPIGPEFTASELAGFQAQIESRENSR